MSTQEKIQAQIGAAFNEPLHTVVEGFVHCQDLTCKLELLDGKTIDFQLLAPHLDAPYDAVAAFCRSLNFQPEEACVSPIMSSLEPHLPAKRADQMDSPLNSAAPMEVASGEGDRQNSLNFQPEEACVSPIMSSLEPHLPAKRADQMDSPLNSAAPMEVASGEGDRQNMHMPASHEQTDVLARWTRWATLGLQAMTKNELCLEAEQLGVATNAINKFQDSNMPKEKFIEILIGVSTPSTKLDNTDLRAVYA